MTASLVFDASAALAWIVPSQGTERSHAFRDSKPRGLIAPFHFRLEVRHAILRLERRKSVVVRSLDRALVQVDAFVEIIEDSSLYPIDEAFQLARLHALGAYDAVYLLLALRTGSQLVSRDRALLEAAQRARVATIDLG